MNNIEDVNQVLEKAKEWFKRKIVLTHIARTKDLVRSEQFNINPFLTPYLSAFLTGKVTSRGIAEALVLPRALGTSISTSLGQNLQNFISEVLVSAYGSVVDGIDIKFVDKIDGRDKYAQLKLGPNTINADDVTTIHNHFSAIRNRARVNRANINLSDLVVCVLYGSEEELSGHYNALMNDYSYPVYVGSEFWHRLTGDDKFLSKLVKAITEVLSEINETGLLDRVIDELAKDPEIIKMAELVQVSR